MAALIFSKCASESFRMKRKEMLDQIDYNQNISDKRTSAPFLSRIINMKMSVFLFFFLFVFSGCLLTVPAHAEEIHKASDSKETSGKKAIDLTPSEKAWLKVHQDITLSFPIGLEPSVIVNDDGSYSGIYVDFLAELNNRLGTRIDLYIDSYSTVIKKNRSKEVDGFVTIHPKNAERLGLLSSKWHARGYRRGYRHIQPRYRYG